MGHPQPSRYGGIPIAAHVFLWHRPGGFPRPRTHRCPQLVAPSLAQVGFPGLEVSKSPLPPARCPQLCPGGFPRPPSHRCPQLVAPSLAYVGFPGLEVTFAPSFHGQLHVATTRPNHHVWGRRRYNFKQATRPGQLRCLGQNPNLPSNFSWPYRYSVCIKGIAPILVLLLWFRASAIKNTDGKLRDQT